MFPYRWILGNQFVMEYVSWDTKIKDVSTEKILGNEVLMEHISVDMDNQHTFP
jgi:hypothetical protein